MRAIIPVAGVGTRLRPHTHTIPKVLVQVLEEAAERTRAILNPEQARKYEELRKRWDRRGSHRRWRGPRSRRSSEEPATQRERPSG